MINQLEIDFNVKEQAKRAMLESRTTDLLTALAGRGWVTARELHAAGFTDRELRDIAEHDKDGQIFSYPGSPGYKIFDEVTMQEFTRCIALKNQGDKMVNRWVIYQRRFHGHIPRKDAAAGG